MLVDDKEYLYVFDCGYLDYDQFDLMTDEGYICLPTTEKRSRTDARTLRSDERHRRIVS